jgi:hypothetical protein
MAITYYEADDFYQLKSITNEIKIFVTFGETCCGGFLIFHDGRFIGANSGVKIDCKEIIDTWITINVILKEDSNKFSWGSVLINIQEDSSIPKMLGPYRRNIEKHVDTVCFTIKIKIVGNSPVA